VSVETESQPEAGGFVIEDVANPRYRNNEIFPAYEDYASPRIWELRKRYHLDELLDGEADEFRRQMLLRNWLKRNIVINNDHPTPTRGDAFGILDAALKGGGFHCAHFMVVQHAVMNAFGYVARSLGVGPGELDDGGHHGVNEVWSNSFCKWMLFDAKYDIHFEKDGVPLSALEVCDEYRKNEGADIVRALGPERKILPPMGGPDEGRPSTYNWCSWLTNTNSFTSWPNAGSSSLVVLDGEAFRDEVWYRGRKAHWAYDAGYFVPVKQRSWIEWTPNVLSVRTSVRPGPSNTGEPGWWAECRLRSFTPNFKEYQLKVGNQPWHPVEDRVSVPLYRDRVEFRLRSVNLFDVTGPEHLVRIGRQER
jgi:hypothetical protein